MNKKNKKTKRQTKRKQISKKTSKKQSIKRQTSSTAKSSTKTKQNRITKNKQTNKPVLRSKQTLKNDQEKQDKKIKHELQQNLEITENKTKKETRKKLENIKEETKQEVKQFEIKHKIKEFKVDKTKSWKSKIIPVIITILLIIALIAYIDNQKYKKEKVEYNRLTTFLFDTNLENYAIRFEDEEGLLTNWEDINSKEIETYARYSIIHLKNKNTGTEESFASDGYFFDYYGKEDILLTSNGSYTIDYFYFNLNTKNKISFTSSNDSVTITDNIITCNNGGDTEIFATFGKNKIKIMDVKATTLLVDRPKEFDETKPFLTCEQFTKEQNDELDKLLEDKIANVGYKTRAATVEALRFLTLDFPYRIQYFDENGRYPYVDGEGRYYHKGLYLSSDRYNYLINPEKENKGTWGCRIYSIPYGGYEDNGLDCSSLMCWALYNAGYDPKDERGANLLMNLGEVCVAKDIIDSSKIKVGDFVHNNEAESHIGMIIGIDDDYYYVAQAIWYKPNGVCISKYTKDKFVSHWNEVVLLDKYYENDGNLTNMWY